MKIFKGKTIISLIVVIYIFMVTAQSAYKKIEKVQRDKLGNERYIEMVEYKYDVDNLELCDATKEVKDSYKKFTKEINEELEHINKYKKAMMIFSNYDIDEKSINECYMNMEAQERLLKKINNLEELNTQFNNCKDLNKCLRETIFNICKKKDNNAYLNRSILEEDWRMVEDLLFKDLIGDKNEAYITYEVNSFGEPIIKNHKDSKRYYKNIYLNTIKLNEELIVDLGVALKEKVNDNYVLSLNKANEYKTYYWNKNCGQDKSLEEKDYIEQIVSICNLAKENKGLLNDVHKHMLEQIEEVIG